MKYFFALMMAVPGFAQAAAIQKAVTYKAVTCQLTQDEKVLHETIQPLMLLQIDDGYGRFVQIQFGDENLKMQYQLLIEDDSAIVGNVIVLQNWMVGDKEASEEISSSDVSWVSVVNEGYRVKCSVSQ